MDLSFLSRPYYLQMLSFILLLFRFDLLVLTSGEIVYCNQFLEVIILAVDDSPMLHYKLSMFPFTVSYFHQHFVDLVFTTI